MRLRVCDGEFERIYPATAARLREIFAPGALPAPGTEITLAAAERWLSATVLPLTEDGVYLMAGGPGLGVIVMGRTAWADAIRQYHAFLEEERAHANG
ncbi:MAG TPA: hypothetical protein VHR43_06705 [Gemmatimonadales bacterium]|jgi:hypothetical protein|nr:hypothetical protein [Gemmatimonadales bacterium]